MYIIFTVGQYITKKGVIRLNLDFNKNKIISLLKAVDRDGIDELIKYLEERTDFFIAPASTRFHGNYKGGLAEHSINVMNILKEKNERYSLNLSDESIVIIGLLHDICKVNFYKNSMKLRRNYEGKWEAYKTYVIDDGVPLGHGEKSCIIIQQFINLTLEECMAIRYHMGAYLPKDEYKNLENAKNRFPLITAVYTADVEASSYLEKTVADVEIVDISIYNEMKRKGEII